MVKIMENNVRPNTSNIVAGNAQIMTTKLNETESSRNSDMRPISSFDRLKPQQFFR